MADLDLLVLSGFFLTMYFFFADRTLINRIYNKILDRDWFSARLFVTESARDHVGVQLQPSDLNLIGHL